MLGVALASVAGVLVGDAYDAPRIDAACSISTNLGLGSRGDGRAVPPDDAQRAGVQRRPGRRRVRPDDVPGGSRVPAGQGADGRWPRRPPDRRRARHLGHVDRAAGERQRLQGGHDAAHRVDGRAGEVSPVGAQRGRLPGRPGRREVRQQDVRRGAQLPAGEGLGGGRRRRAADLVVARHLGSSTTPAPSERLLAPRRAFPPPPARSSS